MKKKTIIAGSISAIVIVAIIIAVVIYGPDLTSGSEDSNDDDNTIISIDTDQTSMDDVIDASIVAYCSQDTDTVEALMYEPILEARAEEEDESYDDFIDDAFFYWNVDDDYADERSVYEFEIDEDPDYEINDICYFSEDDTDYIDTCQTQAEDFGLDITISEIIQADVTVTFSDEEREFYFIILEIDGSWYLNHVDQDVD